MRFLGEKWEVLARDVELLVELFLLLHLLLSYQEPNDALVIDGLFEAPLKVLRVSLLVVCQLKGHA